MFSISSPGFPVDSSGSWSPLVHCTSPWIVRISDITDNMTQIASYNNSTFSPGILLPSGFVDNASDGGVKRWLTSGDSAIQPPLGWMSPGPAGGACTITNLKGQVVTAFVEIDGIKRSDIKTGDCNDYNNTKSYDPINGEGPMGGTYCDSVFNVYDPSIVQNYTTACQSSSDTTCYGIIHVEIDHDWKAAGYCPKNSIGWSCNANLLNSSTTTSTLLDIQGFVYWDSNHTNACAECVQQHSFSGWEIHPLTAWRIHQNISSSTTTTDTSLPSSSTSATTSSTSIISTTTTTTSTMSSSSSSVSSSSSSQKTSNATSSSFNPTLIIGAVVVAVVVVGAALFVRRHS